MIVSAMVIVDDPAGGPGALTPLGGRSMVAHAVRGLLDSGLVDEVVVLGHPDRADAIRAACAGLPVRVRTGQAPQPDRIRTHPDQRPEPRSGDGHVVLLHDAARPLAPPGLAVAALEAMHSGCAAAIPVLPMSDTTKQADDAGIVRSSIDRMTLRVVQTPQAVRRELITGAPLRAALRLAAAGWPVRTVAGHPEAFAVRTDWDLELARLLVADRMGR